MTFPLLAGILAAMLHVAHNFPSNSNGKIKIRSGSMALKACFPDGMP